MDQHFVESFPSIPVFDVRDGGPVALAQRQRDQMEALRIASLSFVPSFATPMVGLGDAIARSWLARSASPYKEDVAKIADLANGPGVYLVNTSYEWACTAATCRRNEVPLLVRTLDWLFAGLGRGVTIARQQGMAGDFWNVTWPGAVGVLTAMAPGRFSATINQAPCYRRTNIDLLRVLDYGANALNTLTRVRHAPPAHVLRQAFETAPDYLAAQEMLCRIPVARPVLVALAGTKPGESCLIERTETEARVFEGHFVVANDWQESHPNWEPRALGTDFQTNSRDRVAAMGTRAAAIEKPFDWLVPPVHNWATRLAVEMSAAEETLRVIGFEPPNDDGLALRATEMFDLARERVAA